MPIKCGDCKYFSCHFPEYRVEWEREDQDGYGVLGDCTWGDSNKIPHSWRYTTREVMGAFSLESIECDTYSPIDSILQDELKSIVNDG